MKVADAFALRALNQNLRVFSVRSDSQQAIVWVGAAHGWLRAGVEQYLDGNIPESSKYP